jgi:hypothetical protein
MGLPLCSRADSNPCSSRTVFSLRDCIAPGGPRAAFNRADRKLHQRATHEPRAQPRLGDEIHVDLAAVLLGAGVRLFDHLANTPAVLGNPTVVTGVGVTHLRYPVHSS